MINFKGFAIIAEIKFASPTNPNLGSPEDLLDRAKEYEKAGADAISIITKKAFFRGDIRFVSEVKKVVKIPILQKDFVIDERQIYEAKKAGADALLLIARIVSKEQLKAFVLLAQKLGIEPVVEVFDEKDLKKAVATKARFIAVNARDLETFAVDVDGACKLIEKIPNKFIKLGFSGIQSRAEVEKYIKAGAKGVLVGTALMKAKNIKEFIGGLR
ncbi:MAG: indole-3-glycerol-phosphate synthase [Candidatus Levybacteria bacterium]|nr:indole-3-glycerol-phosphate synthase [Candidatus Levybacteria bacterium]